MTILPIVGRELRVTSRRGATYWGRFGTVGLALGIAVWVWLVMRRAPSSELSLALFYSVSVTAFFYSLVAGVAMTADSLSEEKREGTLGLLFLTDLKGYDVVLGKLAATSLGAVYRLLGILPVLAVPLLLGGFTMGDFWRVVLVLFNLLFFSLTAGLMFSALSKSARKAAGGTFLLILLIHGVPPLIGAIQAARANTQVELGWLVPSAGYAFALAKEPLYARFGDYYWLSNLITHGLSWCFLAVASLVLPRVWQDRPAGTRGLWWRDWKRRLEAGPPAYRGRLLDGNPYYWVAARNRLKPFSVALGFAGLGALWLWGFYKDREAMLDASTFILVAMGLHLVVKGWVASEAVRRFSEDRKVNAFELLLTTPLTVRDLLDGQMLALKRQFGWAVGLVLLIDVAMFVSADYHDAGEWFQLFLFGTIVFVLDVYALAWVGMWLGLNKRKANQAASAAVGRILILPWLLFLLVVVTLASMNPRFNPEEEMLLALWFGISCGVAIGHLIWARHQLLDRLREVAVEPFAKKGRWWQRWLGKVEI